MKSSELKKLLRKYHCRQIGEYTGHEKWYSPITGKEFPIPPARCKRTAERDSEQNSEGCGA